MNNQQVRTQRLIIRHRIRSEDKRKMSEEEENLLNSDNLGVETILQNYETDCFDQKQKIKLDKNSKIRNLEKKNMLT